MNNGHTEKYILKLSIWVNLKLNSKQNSLETDFVYFKVCLKDPRCQHSASQQILKNNNNIKHTHKGVKTRKRKPSCVVELVLILHLICGRVVTLSDNLSPV